MTPVWLTYLAIASLVLAATCTVVIAADELRHRQHMWIMNLVWQVTALFGSLLAMWAYFKYGRLTTDENVQAAMSGGQKMPNKAYTQFPVMVGKGAAHCGSGCTLGDICAEWLAFGFPVVATWFAWQWLFAERMFAVWVLDFLLAFSFGVAFQYFTIKPMRDLSPGEGLLAAVKADTLSLTAWQVGMYGFMAIAHFYIWKRVIGAELQVNSPEFWFMMQIAMLAGFVTSYPVNWWLIRKEIKEEM
jgi:uncharacterized membrane protein YidH (DUF202 family)